MNIIFPDWFDELTEFEVKNKGFLLNFTVFVNDVEYCFSFYDIHRLIQDYKETINELNFFHEENLVILPEITKNNIINFIHNYLIKNNK